MLKVYMVFFDDGGIDPVEEAFNRIPKHPVDEVAKRPVGRRFAVHEIHEPQVYPAFVLKLTERDIAPCHKSEKDCLQHPFWAIADPACQVPWQFFEEPVQVDIFKQFFKRKDRITDVKRIESEIKVGRTP